MREALVIAGLSGAGKTSVANYILKHDSRFSLVHSATTRAPRGDGNNSEYLYYSESEFNSLIERGEMLEYTRYGDNFYGTPLVELERIFSEGKIPLLILDLNGVKTLASGKFSFKPVIVYVFEDINVIERRLYDRELAHPSAEGVEAFVKRCDANIRDYLGICEISDHFDAFVRNSQIADAANGIISLIFDDIAEQNDIVYKGSDKADLAVRLRDSAIEKVK